MEIQINNELRDRAYDNACKHGFHDKEYSDEHEIWVDISGYEGLYQASSYGRIRSLDKIVTNKRGMYFKKGRIRKVSNYSDGYKGLGLCKNGKRTSYLVHIIIAKTFIKNPFNKRTVNHIDCDKTNNNVSNLEWNTDSENIKYAFKNGRKPTRYWSGRKGINSSRGSHIFQLDKLNNNIINEFWSAMEADRITGVNHSDISYCLQGKLKSAGGYLWVNADIYNELREPMHGKKY